MEKLKNICDVAIKWIFGIAFCLVLLGIFNGSFGIISAIIALFGAIYIVSRFDISHKKFLIILLLISFLIRTAVVLEIRNPQVSDFKTLYDISEDFLDGSLEERSQYYLNAYNFQIYFALIQALFLKLFNKIVFLKLINVILAIGGIAVMYRIINRITNKKTAQIMTILYSVFINPMLYSNILSNQHLFLFLTLVGFDLLFEEKIVTKNWVRFSLVGLILGIANLVRPESILTILTIICVSIYRLLKKEDTIKNIVKKLLPLFMVYIVITTVPMFILRSAGVVKNTPEMGSLYKVVIGLDAENNGTWTEKLYWEYTNQENLHEYEIEKIKEEICNTKIVKMFVAKANIFWNDFGNSWSLSHLTQETLGNTSIKTEKFEIFILDYDQVIWLIIWILALVGVFVSKKDEEKSYIIYVIGATLTYLIIEVQGRYAFIYRPFVFIIASIGLKKILDIFKEKKILKLENIVNAENRVKNVVTKLRDSRFFALIVLALLSYFVMKVTLKFSVGVLGTEMYNTYFNNFWILLLNFLPIYYLSVLFYVLTKKTSISFAVSTAVAYTITLVNNFKMELRNDNLLIEDISLIREALTIQKRYTIEFTNQMIMYIVIFIIIAIVCFFVFDNKKEKRKSTVKEKVISGIIALVLLIIGGVSVEKIYASSDSYEKTRNDGNFYNLWSPINQYIERGTIYSFLHSYSSIKIEKPQGYNKKDVENMLSEYTYDNIEDDKKVNVIGIMLEAYNDFSKFDEIEFLNDPYEKIHKLEEESYSGEIVTNIFAAGTVDTERKFLTGYSTLPSLRKETNSYVKYFKEQGYYTEGSHPGYEWFYNRLNINKNLGFDNYYFSENKYAEYSKDYIADDTVVMSEILSLYKQHKENSDTPYFSFNVTYQNHGPYLDTKGDGKEYLVRKDDYTDAECNIFDNYMSGIEDTGDQICKLVEELRDDSEPVVLILFGDHNPWLGNDNSVYNMLGIDFDLSTEEGATNYYDTPYIIWANDRAKEVLQNDFMGKGEKISPSYLMNKFFELAGYGGNEFMKASNDLRKNVQAINSVFYLENNVYASELSDESKKMLDKFYKMQYYWIYDKK